MRRRPWPIVFLALIQLLAPLASLLVNSWIIHVAPWELLALFFEFHSASRIFEFLGLPAIAAVAVYAMRSWSYPVFLTICAWSLYQQSLDLFSVQNPVRVAFILLSYALNIAFVGYFLIPAVRAAYLDRRLRWWESKPRYKVDLPASVFKSGRSRRSTPIRVLDLSEGGAYFRFEGRGALKLGQEIRLELRIWNLRIETRARIVHRARIGARGYGAQFLEPSHQARMALARLTRSLELLGAEKRMIASDWRIDLQDWISRLFHTGKGLVPDLPAPAKPAAPKRVQRAPRKPLKRAA